MRYIDCLFVLALLTSSSTASERVTPQCTFQSGPINGVLIEREGARLAIYGWTSEDPKGIEQVLLPHGRRDLVGKAGPLVQAGTGAIAPARELYQLEKPHDFWKMFAKSRFHDYGQQSTKILADPLPVDRWVKEGDQIDWRGINFQVLETPGYTRGSISYLADLNGKKVAFTGDLIYGNGQILDLYSFQDAIPGAQIRGYHGYGSRLAELVTSLDKIAAEQPDVIVPARGPLIHNPQRAIDRLVTRVQALYRNYLSTSALHWYFKADRMRQCGRRVLGADADIRLMPYSQHELTPAWVYENATSRLLVSETGRGFLLDCGYQRVIDAINKLISQGVLQGVDGIFVTHMHDDHTDMVQAAAEVFQCPVYATAEYADVLEHPEAYHLPALTAAPIKHVTVVDDGQKMKWHEFDLTFHFFPGQTLYHGALLAKKADERPILFIGDSFAPSGIDDYCILNRNLVHEDTGYLLCLDKLRAIEEQPWLVNQHINYVFAFSEDELDTIERRYRQRIEILRELFPWDDPNYGIDEQWASIYPYGLTLPAGGQANVEVRITNHSPVERTFHVTPHGCRGLQVSDESVAITLASRESGAIQLRVKAPDQAGNALLTADIDSEGMEFRDWIEAFIAVE